MPYIGNEAAVRFVSKPAVDHFSGDGSTTAFTLSFPVASDQDILVSVDGVVQDTTAYAVSSGTTLTFTAAPSSNSGNNIFVNYLARVSATIAHPSTSALTATTGTFTDAVSVSGAFTSLGIDDNADANAITISSGELVGIGETSPTSALHVKGGAGANVGIQSTAGSHWRLGDGVGASNGQFVLYDYTNSGGRILVNADGEVNLPAQPSFYAYPDGNLAVSNSTSLTVFAANTELYDNGSNYNTSTYKFVAPVTGKYLIKWGFRLDSSDSGATYYYYRIYTSNRAYDQIVKPTADETYTNPHNIAIVDLDANDEAYLQYQQYSGTNNHATIVSNSGLTYIQGILLS